ncbi:MAG TPA: cation-transporting P-type ATPase, partial [Quisquiliibacterium sp.]|nr:cation-transporting P-type ATPase [Quisquiliibacterium sp.]
MASQPDAVRGAAEPVGLSAAQAADLLRTVGPNELAAARPRTALQIAWGVATEPMFLLLVACGVIYLLLGDPGEAAMLLGFVVIVMGITLVQQRRTERALDALRDLSSPRALVLRDGRRVRIAGREVVPGDVMEVAEGDRVPADAVLLSGMNVAVDESLLTGESVTVRKASAEGDTVTAMGPPGGDDRPWLFSGTLVVQGKGLARVVATGAQTELGRIGRALEARAPEPTRVQRETGQVVRRIAVAGGVLSLLVALVYALTRDDWLNGLLVGVTMAMALLPEELPVVLTIFLGFGAWRIGQRRVLTRRVPALEMLGAATVLCVYKTGTLTTNRMRMAVACVGDREQALAGQGPAALDESVHTLVEFAVLA